MAIRVQILKDNTPNITLKRPTSPRIGVERIIGAPVYITQVVGHDTWVFEQSTPSTEWIIEHNLNCYPSVSVVDSAGSVVEGSVTYVDGDTVIIEFNGSFVGKAYLN